MESSSLYSFQDVSHSTPLETSSYISSPLKHLSRRLSRNSSVESSPHQQSLSSHSDPFDKEKSSRMAKFFGHRYESHTGNKGLYLSNFQKYEWTFKANNLELENCWTDPQYRVRKNRMQNSMQNNTQICSRGGNYNLKFNLSNEIFADNDINGELKYGNVDNMYSDCQLEKNINLSNDDMNQCSNITNSFQDFDCIDECDKNIMKINNLTVSLKKLVEKFERISQQLRLKKVSLIENKAKRRLSHEFKSNKIYENVEKGDKNYDYSLGVNFEEVDKYNDYILQKIDNNNDCNSEIDEKNNDVNNYVSENKTDEFCTRIVDELNNESNSFRTQESCENSERFDKFGTLFDTEPDSPISPSLLEPETDVNKSLFKLVPYEDSEEINFERLSTVLNSSMPVLTPYVLHSFDYTENAMNTSSNELHISMPKLTHWENEIKDDIDTGKESSFPLLEKNTPNPYCLQDNDYVILNNSDYKDIVSNKDSTADSPQHILMENGDCNIKIPVIRLKRLDQSVIDRYCRRSLKISIEDIDLMDGQSYVTKRKKRKTESNLCHPAIGVGHGIESNSFFAELSFDSELEIPNLTQHTLVESGVSCSLITSVLSDKSMPDLTLQECDIPKPVASKFSNESIPNQINRKADDEKDHGEMEIGCSDLQSVKYNGVIYKSPIIELRRIDEATIKKYSKTNLSFPVQEIENIYSHFYNKEQKKVTRNINFGSENVSDDDFETEFTVKKRKKSIYSINLDKDVFPLQSKENHFNVNTTLPQSKKSKKFKLKQKETDDFLFNFSDASNNNNNNLQGEDVISNGNFVEQDSFNVKNESKDTELGVSSYVKNSKNSNLKLEIEKNQFLELLDLTSSNNSMNYDLAAVSNPAAYLDHDVKVASSEQKEEDSCFESISDGASSNDSIYYTPERMSSVSSTDFHSFDKPRRS